MIYRGYDEALGRSRPASDDPAKSRQISPALGNGVGAPGPELSTSLPGSPMFGGSSMTMERRSSRVTSDRDEYTDLILMVHGIGQGVRYPILYLARLN